MSSDDDSFDDSFDENDIDQAFRQVELTQKLKTQSISGPVQPKVTDNERFKSANKLQLSTDEDKIYEILGENAILKNQLAKLQQEQLSKQETLKNEYLKMVQEKEQSIEALNEHLLQVKSENEFLVSENKSLNQTFNKKRKLRHVDVIEGDLPNQTVSSTQNTSYTNNTSISNISKSDNAIEEDHNNTLLNNFDPMLSSETTKVIVINQATFFQNEKTLFIETLTKYVIPGMKLPVLQYLESVTSSFDFFNNDFQICENESSFKSAILKYLINFQDRDRIDNLLSKFIRILLAYIKQSIIDDMSPLPVPYLIALVNFSLNYKHLAINEVLIGDLTKEICALLSEFPDILKQEFEYLNLPQHNSISMDTHDEIDFSFVEKPIHLKILYVFTAIFLSDVLLTLSKIASVHVFTKEGSACNALLWKNIPEKLLINSLLSRKTPIHFICNTVNILINSIIDEDRFAFENIRMNSLNKEKDLPAKSCKLLEQVMTFLTTFSPAQIHFDIYGLNNMIGSNDHTQLLELVSPPKGKLSSFAKSNAFDVYESFLRDTPSRYSNKDEYILKTKLQILNLFEVFYSSSIMLSLPYNMHIKLLCVLSELIGEEQEMIYRAPRSVNNGIKVELITRSIIIIHHLLEGESIVKVTNLPKLSYRELISNLMKITSNNMKNQSIEFISKLRTEQKYNYTAFIGEQEKKELDSFGLWNSILSIENLSLEEQEKLRGNRAQIEIDLYNGIEFNYPDEVISIARDIFSKLVTEDESERIYKSINYIDQNTAEEFDDFDLID